MNIKYFINYIICFDNIDDILENNKTQSEKIFNIVIKFGFCDIFILTIYTLEDLKCQFYLTKKY